MKFSNRKSLVANLVTDLKFMLNHTSPGSETHSVTLGLIASRLEGYGFAPEQSQLGAERLDAAAWRDWEAAGRPLLSEECPAA